jgi:hypothetical protein
LSANGETIEMKKFIVCSLLLAASAFAQPLVQPNSSQPAPSALIEIEDGGELVEVRRTADFSNIDVRRAPLGSVASSLFMLWGAWAVMRARNAAYFSSAPIGGPVTADLLKFPSTASSSELSGPTKSVFTQAEFSALRL